MLSDIAEVDGTIKWISAFESGCGGHHPALADLNVDGLTVEVIVAGSILHGRMGVPYQKERADKAFLRHMIALDPFPS